MRRLPSQEQFRQDTRGIKIDRFNDPEIEPEEFVQFTVQEDDVELNNYLFYDDTYEEDHHLSNSLRHMYRFPKGVKNLKKDQVVRVYTGKPENHEEPANWQKSDRINEGHNQAVEAHFFYWGIDTDVWNDDGDKITLVSVRNTGSKVFTGKA